MSQPTSLGRFSSNDSSTGNPTVSRSEPLKTSLYGLIPPDVVLWVLSNNYAGLCWPDGSRESMELKNEQDMIRVPNWANRILGIKSRQKEQTSEKFIRKVLGNCSKDFPTIFYLGGHTTEIAGEGVYLPHDCYDPKTGLLTRGISFTDIRRALRSPDKVHPLLFITDACRVPNILELPFVLVTSDGPAYWKETEFYGQVPMDQCVLHFASTRSGELSYGFVKTGAVFTSAMCNFALEADLTLPQRSMGMQKDMDDYMRRNGEVNGGLILDQQHVIYSSKQLDLSDPRILRKLGLLPNPAASGLGER